MKKIFVLILFVLNIDNIYAYENNYFNIDIPDNYKLELEENNSYKWSYNNNYIAITISDNQNLKYDISKFTQQDIDNQIKYIEENINNELDEFDIEVVVTNIKKTKLNDYNVLSYNIYWPTKETTGYDTYQIGNIITTNKYITTIVYSSDNDISYNNDYHNIINTLKIKDSIIKANTIPYIIIIVIIITFILVIIYFKNKQIKKA